MNRLPLLIPAAVAMAIAACTPAQAVEPGLHAPTSPNLSAMGGGQGLLPVVQFAVDNKGGGKLVITDDPCPLNAPEAKGLLGAFTYDGAGNVAVGCWAVVNEKIVVVWIDDATVSVYDPADFTKVTAQTSATPAGKRAWRAGA